jgi:hypothetical protein
VHNILHGEILKKQYLGVLASKIIVFSIVWRLMLRHGNNLDP